MAKGIMKNILLNIEIMLKLNFDKTKPSLGINWNETKTASNFKSESLEDKAVRPCYH